MRPSGPERTHGRRQRRIPRRCEDPDRTTARRSTTAGTTRDRAVTAYRFLVNGEPTEVDAPGMRRLLDVLREDLGLTGTKEGCGEGECGACTVLVDGAAVNSCLIATCQVDGCDVQTVEGMAHDDGKDAERLHRLQRAFLEHGAAQCGICTPGMLMAALALPGRA